MTVGIDGENPVNPWNNPPLKAVHPDDRPAFQPAPEPEVSEATEVTEPEAPEAEVTEPEAPVGTPQDGTVVAEGETEPVPAAPEVKIAVEDL